MSPAFSVGKACARCSKYPKSGAMLPITIADNKSLRPANGATAAGWESVNGKAAPGYAENGQEGLGDGFWGIPVSTLPGSVGGKPDTTLMSQRFSQRSWRRP